MILGGRLPGKVGRCRLFWSYGQAVKTPPFHGGNPGSIPGRITKQTRFSIWESGFSLMGSFVPVSANMDFGAYLKNQYHAPVVELATFTSFTPHSFAVLLSVLPCESPAALRVKRQRSLRSLQRQSRCCRICRADRLTALWTNPQPRSVSANMDSGAYLKNQYHAPVVELADTLDLGSSARAWGFKSLQAHQSKRPQGLFLFMIKAHCENNLKYKLVYPLGYFAYSGKASER